MNLVDSCGWLEYLSDGQNADFFASPLLKMDELLVPSICIYEVFRKVLNEHDELAALDAVAIMYQGTVIELDATLAIFSAKLGRELNLPMADSIILASARRFEAIIWTQDNQFRSIEGVKFIEKKA